MRGLTGKRVVITGAAGGIGAATAGRFLEEGARVVALDRDDQGLHRLQGTQMGLDGAVVVDVTDPDQVAWAFDEVDRLLGGVDVLINNAGISLRHGFLEITPEARDFLPTENWMQR